MPTWEETLAHISETVLADVADAVKADERYAPLIAALTEKAISGLAVLATA